MTDVTQITFPIPAGTLREMLIAHLSEAGYDAFEEREDALLAFISKENFDEQIPAALAAQSGTSYIQENIAPKNWNEQWERDFQPVVVPGFCTVRAGFHTVPVATPYEVIITPKMSFGTGHHATTMLMMEAMEALPLAGARVLDFGSGTGVLAILAEKLGAASVLAVDNDEWAVENAIENSAANGCHTISIVQGSLEAAGSAPFGVILANINLHILLQYMDDMARLLATGGSLLLSGILTEDVEIIRRSALACALLEVQLTQQNNWAAIHFMKN